MAQVSQADTAINHPTAKDSAAAKQALHTKKNTELSHQILYNHPYFNFKDKAGYPAYTKKSAPPTQDSYFYITIVLVLLFAILKAGFEKYFSDLMHLFFRRSLKQRQLKQQVIQNALPSWLFNTYFVLIMGAFVALAIQKKTLVPNFSLWQLLCYATGLTGLIYLGKFFVLKFLGWAFGINKVTNGYIFIIFLVNKIMGILLLPLFIVMALANSHISTIAFTLSILLISALMLYRFIAAIGLIRKDSGIGVFHFLLYVIALEILPTIMIYKGIVPFLK